MLKKNAMLNGKVLFTFLLVGVLLLGCGILNFNTSQAQGYEKFSYEVQPGDSLSKIAIKFYGNGALWPGIYALNTQKLEDPDQLFVGQVLDIPNNPQRVLNKELRQEQVKSKEKSVNLVTSNDYHPYSDENLIHGGMAPWIVKNVFDTAGYDAKINRVGSWSKAENYTADVQYDGALPYIRSQNRKEFVFSDGFYQMRTKIFVTEDSKLPTNYKEEDLEGKVACKPKGYFTSDISDLITTGKIALLRGATPADCFKKLKSGNTDFVVLNRYTGWKAIKNDPALSTSEFKMLKKPAGKVKLRLMVSKDHQDSNEIIEDFNEALNVIKAQGNLELMQTEVLRSFERNNAELLASMNVSQVGIDTDPQGQSINLVTGNNYQPFTDENLPNQGMVTEIVRKACEQYLERPVNLNFTGWTEGVEDVLQGKYRGTFPYVKTAARKKDFAFSDMLTGMNVKIFVRNQDSLKEYNGYSDLEGYTACKPEGYYKKDLEVPLNQGLIELKRAKSAEECFHKLNIGKVDFVTMNEETGKSAIQRADHVQENEIRMLDRSIMKVGLHLMVDKENNTSMQFLEDFNTAIKQMREKGILKEITEKHTK